MSGECNICGQMGCVEALHSTRSTRIEQIEITETHDVCWIDVWYNVSDAHGRGYTVSRSRARRWKQALAPILARVDSEDGVVFSVYQRRSPALRT